MNNSPTVSKLMSAFVRFQAQLKAVKKGAENPFFKSKYADLASIIEAVREPLAANGLAFSQFPTGENQLMTVLMHESGEFISDVAHMTPKDASPQAHGSMLTYLRRYALSAVLGIATEADDDGNAASGLSDKTKPVRKYSSYTASSVPARPYPNVKNPDGSLQPF